jgi:flagellar hook-associated protein 3 FlgL
MTRITHRMMADTALRGLQSRMQSVGDLNARMTSGRAIGRPSDDPAGTVTALGLRSELKAQAQHARNAEDGLAWLATGENALRSGAELLRSARNLTLQGLSTGSTSVEARQAIAVEIKGLRDDLLAVANTSYLGRPVFGGTTGGDAAFAADGTYLGDSGTVQRRLDSTTTVRVDTPGTQVFGADPTSSVLSVLDRIVQNAVTDPEAMRADLDQLDAAFARFTGAVADLGTRYARTERMAQTVKDASLGATGRLAQVEEIDLPRTVLELQTQQVAYQASLAATAKVIQPTLMDFLR